MSLSNPTSEGSKNPAKKFLEWKGGKGVFRYYDKELSEDVEITDPIYIVPLDSLHTIKGWHDASASGIYSNEVRSTKEELVVKSFKGGLINRGLYADIKGNLEGGKYCKSVYAAMLDSNGKVLELVNIGFTGSALSPYIDAEVKNDGKIVILSKNPEMQKKGATKFFIPNVSVTEVRDDILEECKELDRELQQYLNQYMDSKQEAVEENVQESKGESQPYKEAASVDNDSLPF